MKTRKLFVLSQGYYFKLEATEKAFNKISRLEKISSALLSSCYVEGVEKKLVSCYSLFSQDFSVLINILHKPRHFNTPFYELQQPTTITQIQKLRDKIKQKKFQVHNYKKCAKWDQCLTLTTIVIMTRVSFSEYYHKTKHNEEILFLREMNNKYKNGHVPRYDAEINILLLWMR